MNAGVNVLYLVLVGVLVASALIARRPSTAATMRFGLAWVAIFAGGFLAISLWRGF